MKFREQLDAMNACHAAVRWVSERTLKQAWDECERGDWMLWLAVKAGVDRRLIVQAACDCAETAIEYVREDSLLAAVWAIDAARRWSTGTTDLEEVGAAADAAAYAAYAAAYAAYAADAADAAAYAAAAAAYAADAAAYAAADAAAYAAAYAADAADAAADAARKQSLARSAELVRERISVAVIAAAMAQ